jgi:hypothetical protein
MIHSSDPRSWAPVRPSQATEERSRSYEVRKTIQVGSLVQLTRDETQYDRDGIACDYAKGLYGYLLSYANAGFQGIMARIGITTDKGEHELTVSAGILELVQPALPPMQQRVARKRAARRLVARWCQFTPMDFVEGDTALAVGDVAITVTLRVRAADIEKELSR